MLANMSETLSGYKVGFIGLGNMGWPMACHLQDAGADIVVWNRSEGPIIKAAEREMLVATDPETLVDAVGDGYICLNLTHNHVVESIVDIIVPRLAEGAVVIDFGTTGYEETLDFAQRAKDRGANWLDCPVSGGQVGAEAGNLTIMCGGEESAFRRAEPLLQVVGEKITHMGTSGAGQVTKLANQLIVAQTIDAVAQALRMAELAGVDSGLVRDALRGGFAESRILDLHGQRMVNRDFAPGGRSELQLKDVRLMCELADRVGLESTTLQNSRNLWEKFVEELGNGDLDHSGLFKLYDEVDDDA
ncbi:MAG: 2-hydroxy-3-oxopropionate reductase [Verrucomicrobiales bacterium]|nr:2-hydroxy-3-oxopropionate reductase [Verrucomicrobiales bacterium]